MFHITNGISNSLPAEIIIPILNKIIWIEHIINSIMNSVLENQKSNTQLEINTPIIPNVIIIQKFIPFAFMK